MNSIIFKSTVIFSLSLLITSCGKDWDTSSAKDMSMAESQFDDMKKVVEDFSEESVPDSQYGSPGVTVTPAWSDPSYPKTIVIDFGTGSSGWFGKTRKGIITFVLTGPYRTAGTVITTTPTDYYVNDYKVEGQKSVTNNGANAAGNTTFTVEITNGKVTSPSGEVVTWESTRTREWISGENTSFMSDGFSGLTDDVYSITGTASGVNHKGNSFSAEITSPLIFDTGCRWIKQGTISLTPQGKDARILDYGNGNCDSKASVSFRNRTFNINL